MGSEEWDDAYELMETAKNLVKQSHRILEREGFTRTWLDDLEDIEIDLNQYLAVYRLAWIEEVQD